MGNIMKYLIGLIKKYPIIFLLSILALMPVLFGALFSTLPNDNRAEKNKAKDRSNSEICAKNGLMYYKDLSGKGECLAPAEFHRKTQELIQKSEELRQRNVNKQLN
jgi:hypothetical protein